MPDFESAITAIPTASPGASITLTDESSIAKTLVRSDQPQFGLSFGRAGQHGDAIIAATRPDEWLILGEVPTWTIDPLGFTSVIPFTHGRSLFRLTGHHVRSLLAKICNLDFSDPMMPNHAVVSGAVAGVTCDLIRDDRDGTTSYQLMCDRSFGQYLFEELIDAGDEFGISVTA